MYTLAYEAGTADAANYFGLKEAGLFSNASKASRRELADAASNLYAGAKRTARNAALATMLAGGASGATVGIANPLTSAGIAAPLAPAHALYTAGTRSLGSSGGLQRATEAVQGLGEGWRKGVNRSVDIANKLHQ